VLPSLIKSIIGNNYIFQIKVKEFPTNYSRRTFTMNKILDEVQECNDEETKKKRVQVLFVENVFILYGCTINLIFKMQ
jgi:hypothetical protein